MNTRLWQWLNIQSCQNKTTSLYSQKIRKPFGFPNPNRNKHVRADGGGQAETQQYAKWLICLLLCSDETQTLHDVFESLFIINVFCLVFFRRNLMKSATHFLFCTHWKCHLDLGEFRCTQLCLYYFYPENVNQSLWGHLTFELHDWHSFCLSSVCVYKNVLPPKQFNIKNKHLSTLYCSFWELQTLAAAALPHESLQLFAAGPDSISPRLLRNCADQLCEVVMFNLSLSL